MFSQKQELEFNVAFIQQMLEDANQELEQWKLMQGNGGAFQAKISWADPERNPAQVVKKVAWTEQFIELLINRLQQNKLKQKELETEACPAEWAVLRFHQAKILAKMNDINQNKTRLACHDLRDKLLGYQHDFMMSNRELSQKLSKKASSPTKRKEGKVCQGIKLFYFHY